eukprot:3243264-Pleurochrysis_carterae.AAC.1
MAPTGRARLRPAAPSSPDQTARRKRNGRQGPRRCQHCPSSTPSPGARGQGIVHRGARLRQTAATSLGASCGLAVRDARDASGYEWSE